MPELIMLVGLPGSGKHRYIKNTVVPFCGNKHTVFDDVGHVESFDNFQAAIKLRQNCIVTDPYLCTDQMITVMLEKVIELDPQDTYSVSVIYFENDPEQCRKNVEKYKEVGNSGRLISYLTTRYNPPKDIFTQKVYKNE